MMIKETEEAAASSCDNLKELEIARQKVISLEQTIDYLQSKHSESLSHLHREIERLQNQCSDLMLKSAEGCSKNVVSQPSLDSLAPASLEIENECQKAMIQKMEEENKKLRESLHQYEEWMSLTMTTPSKSKSDESDLLAKYASSTANLNVICSSVGSKDISIVSSHPNLAKKNLQKESYFPQLSFKPSVFENLKMKVVTPPKLDPTSLNPMQSEEIPQVSVKLPSLHPIIGENAIKRSKRTRVLNQFREKASRFF